MTSDLDSGGESQIERRRRRLFRVRMWAGAGCFLLANFALDLWGHGNSPWPLVFALLPLLPTVWMVVFIVLRARELDEYQLKLFFPWLAVGFRVAMVTAITLGTLSSEGFNLPNGRWTVAIASGVAGVFTNFVTRAPIA